MPLETPRTVYHDRIIDQPARKPIQVPTWLAVIILTPVLIWAALFLLQLEKGQ